MGPMLLHDHVRPGISVCGKPKIEPDWLRNNCEAKISLIWHGVLGSVFSNFCEFSCFLGEGEGKNESFAFSYYTLWI